MYGCIQLFFIYIDNLDGLASQGSSQAGTPKKSPLHQPKKGDSQGSIVEEEKVFRYCGKFYNENDFRSFEILLSARSKARVELSGWWKEVTGAT